MQDIQKISELITDIKIAMLTTRSLNGELHSRPMATQQIDHEGKLWFFVNISSLKSIEVSKEKNVNIIYSKPDCYISITGHAEITQDPIKIHALWEPRFEAWFPLGLEDEELALLKVHIDFAEYWLSPHGSATRLADFAKFWGGGKQTQEHGRVNISQPSSGGIYVQN